MDGLADAADPGPAMIMRAARIGDADQIREVALRSRLAGRPSLSVRDARFGALRAVTDGMIRAGEVHVAEDTPEVVGYIALQGCWITQLQVRPERRREGIGTALLGIGKERHPSGLLVCCPQHDALARHFVELRGFTAIDVLGELPMILYSWPGKSADL